MMKRKHSAHAGDRNENPKKPRRAPYQSAAATTASIEHPVLLRLYSEVLTLRHYLLSRFPASSKLKSRRRKLSQLGIEHPGQQDIASRGIDVELGELLDATLVGVPPGVDIEKRKDAERVRDRDLDSFTQEVSASINSAGTFKPGYFLQAEVSKLGTGGTLATMIGCSKG